MYAHCLGVLNVGLRPGEAKDKLGTIKTDQISFNSLNSGDELKSCELKHALRRSEDQERCI